MDLVEKLRGSFTDVVDNVRFEGNFISLLTSQRLRVISPEQAEQIQNATSRFEKGRKLVELILADGKKEQVEGLVTALRDTDQPHVANLIRKEDEFCILPEHVKKELLKNFKKLVLYFAEHNVLKHVYQLDSWRIITPAQAEYLASIKDTMKQASELCDIFMSRPHQVAQKLAPCLGRELPSNPNDMPISIKGRTAVSQSLGYESRRTPGEHDESTCIPYAEEETDVAVFKMAALIEAAPRGDREHGSGRNPPPTGTRGPSEHADSGLDCLSGGSRSSQPSYMNTESLQDPTSSMALYTYRQKLRGILERKSSTSNRALVRVLGIESRDGVFFVKLSLAPRDRNRISEDYVMRSAEMFVRWQPIAIEELFLEETDRDRLTRRPKRDLLLGGAGMGKTTALQKFTNSWARNEEWTRRFQIVFYFECRRLREFISSGKEMSLADFIFTVHGPWIKEIGRPEILDRIDSPSTQLLFDGLDELGGWGKLSSDSVPIVCDYDQPTTIPVLIFNILLGNLLPKAKVLFSSRPNENMDLRDFDKICVALGFGEESIIQCMKMLCGNDEKKFSIIMDHIMHNTQLFLRCFIPLTCVLTGATLLQLLKENDNAPGAALDRETLLYIRVVLQVLATREENLPPSRMTLVEDKTDSIKRLTALAAGGILKKDMQIIFSDEDLIKHGITENDTCGLLERSTEYQPVTNLHRVKRDVASFIHLSFQEFFAAVAIIVRWHDDDLEMICQPNDSRRFDMVLLYMSGLLGDSCGHDFIQAIDQNQSSSLLARKADKLFKVLEFYGREAGGSVNSLTRLQIVQCLSEGRFANEVRNLEDVVLLQKQAIHFGKNGLYKGPDMIHEFNLADIPSGLMPHHLATAAYFLDHATKTTGINLGWNHIGKRGADVLMAGCKDITQLKELWLESNNLTDDGINSCIPVMEKNTHLEKIGLGADMVTCFGAASLSKALIDHYALEILDLSSNRIGDHGATALAKLITNLSSLQRLDLQFNEISDSGADSLGCALEGNTTMTLLLLCFNLITEEKECLLIKTHGSRIRI